MNIPKEIKFDRFYYSVDGTADHYLVDLLELSDKEIESLYRGKMFCPECQQVQLDLVRNKSCYLRSRKEQKYIMPDGKACIYSYEPASKTTVNRYIKNLNDQGRVKILLESVMRNLLLPNIKPRAKTACSITTEPFENPLVITETGSRVRKGVIPHYVINNVGASIPEECLVLVYGKAYVKNHNVEKCIESETKVLRFLRFYDIKTHKRLLTSCLKPTEVIADDGEYYVVMIGTCFCNRSGNIDYYNITLNSPGRNAILLQSIKNND